MAEIEEAPVDVFQAYSPPIRLTSEDMGFTVHGGMPWLRAAVSDINVVAIGSQQVQLQGSSRDDIYHGQGLPRINVRLSSWIKGCTIRNEMEGHLDRNLSKPSSLQDYPWKGMTGVSSNTKH
jgi:hypothetical protein